MPLGRPDFWYGQVLLFEEEPTDGRTDAGPTSNWAYDHKLNASVHHARYADSEADARIALHAAIAAAHHARYADSEADARIALHAAIAAAHHARYADSEADARIAIHTAIAAAHHAKYTDTEAQAACWPVFIDRGDPVAVDKSVADFTVDLAWTNMDLSSIIAAGAKAVLIKIYARATAAANFLYFRKDGNSNEHNIGGFATQVANVGYHCDVVIPLPTSRIIEYYTLLANWTILNLVVKGWWL